MTEHEKANVRSPYGPATLRYRCGQGQTHKPRRLSSETKLRVISDRQRRTIFAIRRQLGWSEEEHQAVMAQAGVPEIDGRRSTNSMTQKQWEAYVRHAVNCGFDSQMPAIPPADRPSKAAMFMVASLQYAVVMARSGRQKLSPINDAIEASALKFAQGVIAKATAGKPQNWWTPADAAKAIEALRDVLARFKANGQGENLGGSVAPSVPGQATSV